MSEINFNNLFYLIQYNKNIMLTCYQYKNYYYFTLFYPMKSLKYDVYFILLAHLSLDLPHFKCSIDTCG